MTIALVGATGLTGNLCLEILLKHHKADKIYSIGRRPTDLFHPKLTEIELTDLEMLDRLKVDAFICCLGTTIKKAGSKKAFEAVDLDLPLMLAKKLKQNGCQNIAVISAMGADIHSKFFYNRVKGKMEKAMQGLGYRSLAILRPSFIDGKRTELRIMEKLGILAMKLVTPLLTGSYKSYRPVDAKLLAKALCNAAFIGYPGTRIYQLDDIKKLAAR